MSGVSHSRKRTGRPRRLFLVGIVGLGALAGPAAAAGLVALHGPSTVIPGRSVKFTARGLAPRAPVRVTVGPLQIGGDASARSVTIRRRFRVGAGGGLTVRFRWPARDRICRRAGRCTPVPWHNGGSAYVSACLRPASKHELCLTKEVRLRLR
jgi:hypothetical protein